MIRTTLQPNRYRTTPLPSTYRLTPVAYSESAFYVSQGRAKRVQLGQVVHPFSDMFVKPASDVTQIRFKVEFE